MTSIPPCTRPTMYFVGVTTGQSSIMRIFPRWMEVLGIDAQLLGHDIVLRAPAEDYRRIVEHIRHDPLAYGALVTTHKIDLLNAASDRFDQLQPNAALCREVSSIYKRDGQLIGDAKDPISSGLAWRIFVQPGHFASGAQVLCLGAGGAAVALSVYLSGLAAPSDRPARFIVVDINQERLDNLKAIHSKLPDPLQFEYILSTDPVANDQRLHSLPSGSVIVNATGMGKDRPGSPITDAGQFPSGGVAWEMNYRGELNFLHQARAQAEIKGLKVVDGWDYFLYGWTQVVADVFNVTLTDDLFARMAAAAG